MAQHTITLDDYQVANLRSLIEAMGYPWDDKWRENPLIPLNSGDWVGEIYCKLPKVDFRPNKSPEEMRDIVRKRHISA